MKAKLNEARKAIVAALGLVAQAVSLGVLHGTALHDAQIILALATTVGVWAAPNKPIGRAPALPPAGPKG